MIRPGTGDLGTKQPWRFCLPWTCQGSVGRGWSSRRTPDHGAGVPVAAIRSFRAPVNGRPPMRPCVGADSAPTFNSKPGRQLPSPGSVAESQMVPVAA